MPVGLKKRLLASIPSSTIPTLMPSPLSPVAAEYCVAPITPGLRLRFWV